MNPTSTSRSAASIPSAASKETPRMPVQLVRLLDAASHVAVVFLALYVGVSTFGLGV
jgi:hypothetical protein